MLQDIAQIISGCWKVISLLKLKTMSVEAGGDYPQINHQAPVPYLMQIKRRYDEKNQQLWEDRQLYFSLSVAGVAVSMGLSLETGVVVTTGAILAWVKKEIAYRAQLNQICPSSKLEQLRAQARGLDSRFVTSHLIWKKGRGKRWRL